MGAGLVAKGLQGLCGSVKAAVKVPPPAHVRGAARLAFRQARPNYFSGSKSHSRMRFPDLPLHGGRAMSCAWVRAGPVLDRTPFLSSTLTA